MQINLPRVSYEGMGTKVREYRANMSSEQKADVAQLKAAREALKQAHKTGDKSAIETAKQAVLELEDKIHDNVAHLKTVQNDVAGVRTARRQLASDVRSGNKDSIPQDISNFNSARDQVFTDIEV